MKSKFIKKPNFIIPGAGRSGTTFLYQYLNQHPNIYLLWYKEPNYFSIFYDLGENWYLDLFNNFIKEEKIFDLIFKNIRSKIFKPVKNQKVIGEASTYYMVHPKVPERMYKFNPNFKIIFVLRDPIKRAVSNYKRDIQMRGINESFENLINESQNFLKYSSYLNYGLYFKNITRFLNYFSIEQTLFLLFEDLISNPDKELKKILDFLQVERKFKFNHKLIKKNPSNRPNSLILQKFISTKLRPNWRESYLKQSFKFSLRYILNILNHQSKPIQSIKINEETLIYLKNFYKKDIENLEQLINRDLVKWK